MRFFMIYSNQFAVGNKPNGLAALSAVLKQDGHVFQLFDCTSFNIYAENKQDWNLVGQKSLQFKVPDNPERLPERERVTYQELIARVHQSIGQFKPDVIGLSALTDDYPLGLGIMKETKKLYPSIPTIAGGVHATVDPEGVISQSCFDMVCVGEGEYVVLDMAECVDQKKDFSGIKNLWIKLEDGSVEKNAVRPYEQNLDVFPFPDWSIYSESAFYKPFHGHVYKYGDFEMSRGCPFKCSYCINVQLQEIYKKTKANYHREKSIPRVIQEIKWAREKYDIEFLKFWDETFLLMDHKRMQEFCDLYSSEIGIPYVIETTATSITPFSSKVLYKTNCKSVSLGMETGSPDMRKGILHKPTGNDAYQKAYELLDQYGINKVSFNMLGLPNESQQGIFQTIAMNRLVGTDSQSVGIFYPYKGTPIRRMMVEQKWIEEDFDVKALEGYDFNTFTAGNGSVVLFKDMDGDMLNRLWLLFSAYCVAPVKLWPLLDYIKNHDQADLFSNVLWDNMSLIIYLKKFDEWLPGNEQVVREGYEEGKYDFDNDAEANSFAEHLLKYWQGSHYDDFTTMLQDIASCKLTPDFTIPEDEKELHDWLGLSHMTSADQREMRSKLRKIAAEDSEAYSSGNFNIVEAVRVS